MKVFDLLRTPFPRPERSGRNLMRLLLFGLGCSLFVILVRPFGIENVYGQWYYPLLIFSIGVLFVGAILVVEWLIPALFPRPFRRWTLGKAILYYTLATLVVGAVVFMYKSYLGGFRDFTFTEYFLVIGRLSIITLTVIFFALGARQYLNRRQLSLVAYQQTYTVTPPTGKPFRLRLGDILFVSSDDNYVDLHYLDHGERKKVVMRSSLKNLENQIVHPLSPVHRCHRRYLVNVERFEILRGNRRKMLLKAKDCLDEIPVSKSYAPAIGALLER